MKKNKEKNFISAVVYVHNNQEQIEEFLQKVNTILDNNFEKYEIICVNDNCTDNTAKHIKDFAVNVKNAVISIINMSSYHGAELAMNAGVDLAIGDFVFEFDHIYIDYEVNLIMQVYERSLMGFDIVSASPQNISKNTSRLFYYLFNKFSSTESALQTETFRILSRRVINRIHSLSKTIPYRKAIYANCGLKIDRITYKNVASSLVGLSGKRSATAMDSLVLFTDIAYKVAIAMTGVMMSVSILVAIYAILIFLENKPVAGWTTTMLFLSVGFFGIFGVMTIIIKYLDILLDLTFKKKSYTTESIEKITKQ